MHYVGFRAFKSPLYQHRRVNRTDQNILLQSLLIDFQTQTFPGSPNHIFVQSRPNHGQGPKTPAQDQTMEAHKAQISGGVESERFMLPMITAPAL